MYTARHETGRSRRRTHGDPRRGLKTGAIGLARLPVPRTPAEGARRDLRHIAYGETKTGEIDVGDPTYGGYHAESVAFEGEAGDEVLLEVETDDLSGAFYAVEDPSGEVFTEHGHDGGYGDVWIGFTIALLDSGTYTFWVGSYPTQE